MGFATDQELLDQRGRHAHGVAGCCGLAGNFGMEKGHYEMSLAVAENALLPALREAGGTSSWPTASPAGPRSINSPGCQATLAELLASQITNHP